MRRKQCEHGGPTPRAVLMEAVDEANRREDTDGHVRPHVRVSVYLRYATFEDTW